MFQIAEKQVTNISHLGVGTIPIFFNKSIVDLQCCFTLVFFHLFLLVGG